MFPGLSRYYTPFFAPTADSPLTGRGLRDMHPDHNRGVPVVPQLLTNRAEDFIASARLLQDLGYKEVNLNLGCPSGTVVAKKKGAGFLSQPQALARFLDQIFQTLDVNISIKTRIGVENLEEWPPLLDLFQRYPICELIIHPRLRRDFYRGQPRREAFTYAVAHSRLPLCYNGDLFSPQDCWDLARQFPSVDRLMAGRGLVCNPALGRQLQGGPPLTKAELQAFHDRLLDGYQSVLSGDWPVLGKMKELWSYWARLFPAPEKPLKAMRKAKTLTDYTFAAQSLFRDQDLLPGAHFPPPGHPRKSPPGPDEIPPESAVAPPPAWWGWPDHQPLTLHLKNMPAEGQHPLRRIEGGAGNWFILEAGLFSKRRAPDQNPGRSGVPG